MTATGSPTSARAARAARCARSAPPPRADARSVSAAMSSGWPTHGPSSSNRNGKPTTRATRPKVERKLGHLMRRKHGGRRARVRGKDKVDADFNLLAAAVNLARLTVLGVRSTGTGWVAATALNGQDGSPAGSAAAQHHPAGPANGDRTPHESSFGARSHAVGRPGSALSATRANAPPQTPASHQPPRASRTRVDAHRHHGRRKDPLAGLSTRASSGGGTSTGRSPQRSVLGARTTAPRLGKRG